MPQSLHRVLVLLALSVLAGCSTPKYDAQMDQDISVLQTDIDTYINTLISLDQQAASLSGKSDPASVQALAKANTDAGYQAGIPTYAKIQADFDAIGARLRIGSDVETAPLTDSLGHLHNIIFADQNSMVAVHKTHDKLGAEFLKLTKSAVDADATALITYELVLKGNGAAGTKPAGSAAAPAAK